ncbi:alpha-galactosidase [Secundilactobacillus yichangensis]|uniref:alpha-galactosidase n=1 Tax=Secundilactobacillus yichangensis TaxID=2799580 RepID=UPI001941A30C|nr:alpha-galactosidase [Secundilactobacillus yichangensis]
MAIHVDEANQTFHLQTDHTSYIFQVLAHGILGQVYYGKKIHVKPQYNELLKRELKTATPAYSLDDPDFQLGAIKQEYSDFGTGDFRRPAYQLTQPNGSRITDFKYDHYEVVQGKQRLTGLPSTFDDTEDDAETLIVHLTDKLIQLDLDLSYTVFPHQDVIVRSANFKNHGVEAVTLNAAESAQLDLPDSQYDLIQFSGTWARERHLIRTPLRSGIQAIDSVRTTSSHQQNPFMMLARPNTTDDNGEAIGFNLVYSGNFLDQIEVDQWDVSRVLVGINPAEFGWKLEPGKEFQTPEAILSYTADGMNQLSQQLASFYSEHLVNAKYRRMERPILVNNWEATYFDFNDEKLLNIAKQAKRLGIEMFVLDDGWFGHRNDDHTSLGDWFVDPKKLPNGIGAFAGEVHDLGLKFGLWFEPEMISIDSELYKKHPEWLIHVPKRRETPGRNQYVLDFSRPEVVDYIYQMMAKVIQDTKLDYIKWDMNRYITEMYSVALPADRQLEMPHRYILGVYDLYARLTKAFPDVLFESCASGGGRFDLGMMYYAPQAWASDDTDAVERMKVQFGTSYGYPQSMMGAHVSAVPNEQNGRITPLETRANVAFYGAFGYELDISKMSEEEANTVKKQVVFYKQHRALYQFGKLYRLDSPFEGDGNVMSWVVVDDQQDHAIATRYQILNHPNAPYSRLYLKGLDPDKQYRVNDSEEAYYGDELMNAGIHIGSAFDDTAEVKQSADFSSRRFMIDVVK